MDFNDGDWGYRLGLLCLITGGIGSIALSPWLLTLWLMAFVLCWTYG